MADLMVDIVLVAATDAGAKTALTAQVVQAIRDNSTSGKRPDIPSSQGGGQGPAVVVTHPTGPLLPRLALPGTSCSTTTWAN